MSRRGRGRGRGRGGFGNSLSLESTERRDDNDDDNSTGLTKLKVPKQPSIKEPPLLFPPFENFPRYEFALSKKEKYLVEKSGIIKRKFTSSPYFLTGPAIQKDIERYSDKYINTQNLTLYACIPLDSARFPDELISEKVRAQFGITSKRKREELESAKNTKLDIPLDIFSRLEQQEQVSEKADSKKKAYRGRKRRTTRNRRGCVW